jgi:hypothetical protein
MLFFPRVFFFVFKGLRRLDGETDPGMGVHFNDNIFKIFFKILSHVYADVHDRDHNIPFRACKLKDHKRMANSYKLKSHEEGRLPQQQEDRLGPKIDEIR